jgi:hypothetical protein
LPNRVLPQLREYKRTHSSRLFEPGESESSVLHIFESIIQLSQCSLQNLRMHSL